jgi:SAM-dependent methyltransferase
MDKEKLYRQWKHEEKIARIQGWDFSHIDGRYIEEDRLPWDFKALIQSYLSPDMNFLDMETGGGEFLLSLGHPHCKTSAIEGYPPNVAYCQSKLLPLGIDFKEADGTDVLPFSDSQFDIVTNRHGDYTCPELRRVLKSNGLFLTQQVGAENDRELIRLLQPEIKEVAYPKQYLAVRQKELMEHGFEILDSGEAFQPIQFFDVGALVWFARIIEWEFPGFEVDKYLDNLYKAQEILERNGAIEGRIHRFYMAARKL